MAGFFDRIREGAEKAAFEADRLRRLSQAQSELRALFRRLESDTAGLGRRMLQLHDDGALTQPELLEECTAIAPVRQEIEAKEYEIQRIREEKPPEAPRAVAFGHICPKCKIELPDKALFCHVCGSKAVDIAPPTPADSFVCSHCGEGLEPAAALCPHCGTRVQTAAPVASVVCPNCGATIPAEATFCPECGQSRAPGAAPGLASEEGGVVTEAPTVVAGPREPEPRPAEIQAATRACSYCGTMIPEEAVFCPECGQLTARQPDEEELPPGAVTVLAEPPEPEPKPAEIQAATRACSYCGAMIPEEAAFCPECGHFTAPEPEPTPAEIPVVARACSYCGAMIPEEAVFCPECGYFTAREPHVQEELPPEAPAVLAETPEPEPTPAEMPAVTRACSHCDAMIPEEAVFCPECGQDTAREPSEEEELPPEAATVLTDQPEPEPTPAEMLAATRACSHCGVMIPEEAVFCPECGQLTARERKEEHAAPEAHTALAETPGPEPMPDEMPAVTRACSHCDAMIPEEAVFCPECGQDTAREPSEEEELPPEAATVLTDQPEPEPTPAEIPAVTRACSHCGAMIPEEAVFCPECGQDTAREPEVQEELPPEAPTALAEPPEPEPMPAEIPAVTRACSHCGAMIPEEAVFCPECGQFSAREPGEEEELPPEAPTVLTDQPEPEPTPAEVPAATRACSYCGAMIPEKAVFCPECGRPPEPAPAPKPTADVVPPPREKAEDESIPLPGDTLRLMRCPKCHAGIPAEALSCPECGHSLARTSGAPGHAEPYPVPEGAPILGSEHVAEPSGVPEEPLELGMATARDVPEQEKSAPTDRVPPATMSCPHCLGLIEPDMEYCPHCRQPLVDQEAESAERPSRPQDAAEATPQPEPVIKAGSRAPATCPFCLGLVRADAEVCPTCGQPLTNLLPEPLETRSSAPEVFQPENAQAPDQPILPSDDTLVMMRCPHCRASIPAMAAFCPECGARLS